MSEMEDVLRRWKTWCPKCDCLQHAKPALKTRRGGLICVCGEPMIEVVVVSAAHSEGAVDTSGSVHVDALSEALGDVSNDIDGHVAVAEVIAAVLAARDDGGQ